MSYFAETLVGAQIHSVLVDSEVTYIMLKDGTQVTIRGLVVVQPRHDRADGVFFDERDRLEPPSRYF